MSTQFEQDACCNFTPKVVSLVDKIGEHGNEQWVKIKLEFDDGSNSTIELPLSELEGTKWSQKEPRCILNSKRRDVTAQIANYIRSQLSDNLPCEKRYKINRLGLDYIKNTIVFVAGDRVYTRSSDKNVPVVETDENGFRLDVDENITLQEAFDGLSELIALVPGVGWVLFAHTISGIIREAFIKAGFTPNTILMIVGESGMRKSSYVPHITQLYNRNDGVKVDTRFNSTLGFIEDSLFEYRNCTYVIDDIHTGSASTIKKNNETTAEEIIRRISDNTGRGRKNGKELVQRSFEGNAVFIGEYTIGAESTIPRVLFVEINQKPDGIILDKYQRSKKLLMSTFYSYFIQW